ncbi:hypothetical protein M3Y96_00303900 [Aphelenchoides besseyi]|nr:hypothetical protein M3Y96_00303900 [Aphelenchoides besseyi]
MLLGIKTSLLLVLFGGFVGISFVSSVTDQISTVVEKKPYNDDSNYPRNHTFIFCDGLSFPNSNTNTYVYNKTLRECITGEYNSALQKPFISYEDCMATCVWRCNNGLQPFLNQSSTEGFQVASCESDRDCPMPTSKYPGYGRSCTKFKTLNSTRRYCCYGPKNVCYRSDVEQEGRNTEHIYWRNNTECEECELACLAEDVCDSGARPWVEQGKVRRYNKEDNKNCKPGDGGDFWYLSFKKAKDENDGVCCPGRPQLTYVTQFTASTPQPTTRKTTIKEEKTSSITALKSEVESFTVRTSKNSTTESRNQTSNEESTQPSKPSLAVEMSSSTEKSTTREVNTSTDQSTQSSTVSSTESTSMPTSESSSEPTQSSTISSTKERTLTPVVPPSKPHSSTVVAINSPKEKEKRSSLILIISLVVVAILLVVLALSLLAFFLHRRNKKAQEREDEIALRRNAARIAEFQALQKKKAEMKKNEKVPPRKLRGQIIEGLPPPGPVGWEPDQISARKFKHMGPLKWEQRPPVTMVHALEKDEPPVLNPDQHIEWDDEQNFVVDIGSEVEEVYRNGQRVMPAKRPSAQPRAHNTPRRSAENRQLKAIRED